MPNTTPQNNSTIYQQIESDAGYYPPAVYDILTRYDSFQSQYDPEAQNYIPFTSALQSSASQAAQSTFLPFIIGLIPPAAPAPQVLNRSATVGSLVNSSSNPQFAPPQTGGGSQTASGDGSNGGRPANYVTMSNLQKANAITTGLTAVLGSPPTQTQVNMVLAQSIFEQGGGSWPDFNPGGIGFRPASSVSSPPAASFYANSSADVPGYYSSFSTAESGATSFAKIINGAPGALTAAANADPTSYVAALKANGYFGGNQAQYTAGVTGIFNSLQANPNFNPASVAAATPPVRSNIIQEAPPPGPNGSSGNQAPQWQPQGAPAAQAAQTTLASIAQTTVNRAALSQTLVTAQNAQINATTAAIQQMANTPPLQMLVSPTSFKCNVDKIVADGNWGRSGPIIEHWGNQQEKIEGSGKLAAFYALDNSPTQYGTPAPGANNDGPGLTRMARSYSASYQNFLSLYLLYKSNGGIYLNDAFANAYVPTGSPQRVNLSLLGSVYLYYDSTMYVGSFDNFTITETDQAPFTLEYSFTFTVRAWFLLDRQQSPTTFFGTSPSGTSIPGGQVNVALGGAVTSATNATGGIL